VYVCVCVCVCVCTCEFVDQISSMAKVLRDFTYGGKRWNIT
jgi:hypothetical protein